MLPSTARTIVLFFIFILFSKTISAQATCSGASTLTVGTTCSTTSGNLKNAANAAPTGGCGGASAYGIWYKFQATNTTATIAVSSLGSTLTTATTYVELLTGTCGSFTSTCQNVVAPLNVSGLLIGTTYYIRVYVTTNPNNSGNPNQYDFSICVVSPPAPVIVTAGRMNEVYKQTILSDAGVLQYPWEITYGPDDNLWITESRGYKVYRMDPNTGIKTTVLDLSTGSTWLPSPSDSLNAISMSTWSSNPGNWPQGGLAGLAIHPQFGDGTHDFVYVSYVHRYLYTVSGSAGIFYRNKIVRFTYNSGTGKLGSPAVVCDTIPGGQDHNSQRMIIAPVIPGGTNYLFYAAGDMGAGQYGNRMRPENAQNPDSYEGKILRFNLDTTGNPGPNKWIPNDNPYSSSSAVYSIGIRNNQGFAYDTATNKLYGASHGPYSDDEINIIESRRNYGHPLIEGFVDGNYNGNTIQGTSTSYSAGAGWNDNSGVSSCPPIGNEATNKALIDASGNGLYKDPLFSAYAAPLATVANIWTNNIGGNPTSPIVWPTEAWSGLDIYNNKIVPGWKHSLVAASLKLGRLVRLKLGAAGSTTMPNNNESDTISYFNSKNRFRDLAFSPDGKDLFVIMDNSSTTSGPGNANPVVSPCAGCVQKYTFLGYADAGGKSTIPTSIDVTDGTVNTCTTGTTVTIDASNSNYWVPITGPDGNIMAEIYANGNNLGTVTSSFYKNSGPIRIKGPNRYLDRNITITPQTQPSTPVKIRLYISKAEFDALDADMASGISAITDLKILKNSDLCGSTITGATTLLTPTNTLLADLQHGANGYVLQYDNLTSFSSFYFSSSNIALPVELVTFSGSLQNNNIVLLKWKTENEVNTSHFMVERSIDGYRFNDIGTISANGNNNGSSFIYSFTDADAGNQQSLLLYYRLKLVDINGSFKYSNVITISLADITGKLTVSPNPVVNELKVNILAPADGRIQWKLIDNTSRVILQNSEHVKKGNGNSFIINMNKLSRGSYYLNVSGAGIDQKIKLQKL
jgi:PQQ-dependent dehydrogenase (s-GDH family)